MSNLYSTVSNYSGRQPDNVQGIKQFVTSISNAVLWIYKRIYNTNTSSYSLIITPATDNDVILPKDLYVDGLIYGTLATPSDERIKKNIKEISKEDQDNIFNLNPVQYEYINDKKNVQHYGLIAQDVEKYYPELVSTNMNYKSINYNELLPCLL